MNKYKKLMAILMLLAIFLCGCSDIKRIKPAEKLGVYQTAQEPERVLYTDGYWYSLFSDDDGSNMVYSLSVSQTPGELNTVYTMDEGFIFDFTANEKYAVWLERKDAYDNYVLFDQATASTDIFMTLDSTQLKEQHTVFHIYNEKVYYLFTEGFTTSIMAYSIQAGHTETVYTFPKNTNFQSIQMEEDRLLAVIANPNEERYIFHFDLDTSQPSKIHFPAYPEPTFEGRYLSYDRQTNTYGFAYFSDINGQKVILISPDSNEIKDIADLPTGTCTGLLCRNGHLYLSYASTITSAYATTDYDFIHTTVQEINKIDHIFYTDDCLYGLRKSKSSTAVYRVI